MFRTLPGTCHTVINGPGAERLSEEKKRESTLFSESSNRFACIPSWNQWLFSQSKQSKCFRSVNKCSNIHAFAAAKPRRAADFSQEDVRSVLQSQYSQQTRRDLQPLPADISSPHSRFIPRDTFAHIYTACVCSRSVWLMERVGTPFISLEGERGIVLIGVLDFRVSVVGKASEGKGHAATPPFLW